MLPLYAKEELNSLDFGLAGKTAIITGGTAGIGNETAKYFLAQGANVVISGRKPEVDKIAKEMGGDRAVGVQGDICDAAHRAALIEAGVKKENIAVTNICTCCNPDLLFSHRASKGKRGNLGAFMYIR